MACQATTPKHAKYFGSLNPEPKWDGGIQNKHIYGLFYSFNSQANSFGLVNLDPTFSCVCEFRIQKTLTVQLLNLEPNSCRTQIVFLGVIIMIIHVFSKLLVFFERCNLFCFRHGLAITTSLFSVDTCI
jgi:hypothetical protein